MNDPNRIDPVSGAELARGDGVSGTICGWVPREEWPK